MDSGDEDAELCTFSLETLEDDEHQKKRGFLKYKSPSQIGRKPELPVVEKPEEPQPKRIKREEDEDGDGDGDRQSEKGAGAGGDRSQKVEGFFDRIYSERQYKGQIAHIERVEGQEAIEVPLALMDLQETVKGALRRRGIERLYTHQADAVNAILGRGLLDGSAVLPSASSGALSGPPSSSASIPFSGDRDGMGKRGGGNVVAPSRCTMVVARTSGGKSLCFMLPILEAFNECQRKGETFRALLLFPTKALAQDQLGAIKRLAAECCPDLSVATYDGDTPKQERAAIRESCHLLLSNPDMLHVSVLPCCQKEKWDEVLKGLRFVVVDEAHYYRGVFGSHVALVLRRLRRLCRFYRAGTDPQFVLCSATVANPREHAAALTGVKKADVVLVDRDGAPRGPKLFAIWNPPLAETETEEGEGGKETSGERKEKGNLGRKGGAGRGRGRGKAVERRKGGGRSAVSGLGIPEDTKDPSEFWAANLEGADEEEAPSSSSASSSSAAAASSSFSSHGGKGKKSGKAAVEGGGEKGEVGSVGRRPGRERESPYMEAAFVLSELVAAGLHSLCFVKVRSVADLIVKRTRELLVRRRKGGFSVSAGEAEEMVLTYKGGFTPAERRELEGKLQRGEVLGVVSTNALELGVDIGCLDATVHVGFPGTAASLWQQAGRAGRTGRGGSMSTSLAVLVCLDGPLDQHFAREPRDLFSRPVEAAHVNPNNEEVLLDHLKCAALERPLSVDGRSLFSPAEWRLYQDQVVEAGEELPSAGEMEDFFGSLALDLCLKEVSNRFGGACLRFRRKVDGEIVTSAAALLDVQIAPNVRVQMQPQQQQQQQQPTTVVGREKGTCASTAVVIEDSPVAEGRREAEFPWLQSSEGSTEADRACVPGSVTAVVPVQLQQSEGGGGATGEERLQGGNGEEGWSEEDIFRFCDGEVFYGGVERVANGISLRSIDPVRWSVIDSADGTVLETYESWMAVVKLYPGAVYLHQGKAYLITQLQENRHAALARRAPENLGYFTESRDHSAVHVLSEHSARAPMSFPLFPGSKVGASEAFFGDSPPASLASSEVEKEQESPVTLPRTTAKSDSHGAAAIPSAASVKGAQNGQSPFAVIDIEDSDSETEGKGGKVPPAGPPSVLPTGGGAAGVGRGIKKESNGGRSEREKGAECRPDESPVSGSSSVRLQPVVPALSGSVCAKLPFGSVSSREVSEVYVGSVRVEKKFYGYRKRDARTFKILDVVDVAAAGVEFVSQALWFTVPSGVRKRLRDLYRGRISGADTGELIGKGPVDGDKWRQVFERGALHGLEHLVLQLCPLLLSVDPGDLSCQHTRRERDANAGLVLFFETNRGGTGLCKTLAPLLPRLLRSALSLVRGCACERGCPRCVHVSGCGEYNLGLHKEMTRDLLQLLVEGEGRERSETVN